MQATMTDNMDFNTMLDDVYEKINNNRVKSNNLVLPELVLINNNTKIIWKNVKDFLRAVRRSPDHLLNFFNYEFPNKVNWISESKSDGLNFTFRIKKEVLNQLLIKYIKEYVICKSCKSVETYIEKDKQIRKYIFKCVNCNNSYSI